MCYRPCAGVEEGVAGTVGYDQMAVITRIVQAQETIFVNILQKLHIFTVVHHHAAVISDGQAGCRTFAFNDGRLRGACV